MTKGAEIWAFEYDVNGMRTKRACGDTVYTYVYSGSQLTAMAYSWHKFLFTYDAAGKPLTLEYHDTLYCQAHNGGACGSLCKTLYYVTNLQGDVIALLDSSGDVDSTYTYDAWGNLIGSTGSRIGRDNPLRYRGYVYDRETKLYYLQSRYYNPEIGRFISADAYVSTGQGILSNNMFAYCGNNPVIRIDPTGENFKDWLKDAWADVCDFFVETYECLTNTDADAVLEAEHLAFYKGVPVIKIDAMGNNAFSFGIIFMGNGNLQSKATVKHEYGHTKQLVAMGMEMYLLTVAIPSLYGFWSGAYGENYYNTPWERMADKMGEVTQSDLQSSYRRNRTYSSWSEPMADLYFNMQVFISMLL